MSLWFFLALTVPFTLGVVNVLDKLIVDRYAPTVLVYGFWVGLLELFLGGFMLLGLSFGDLVSRAIFAGVIVGVIQSISFLILMAALKGSQLSRVAPVYQLNPLIVAPMSAGFLGEELSGAIWGAVSLAVLGAVLVSWQGGVGARWAQPRAQGLALTRALLFAVSNVLSKYFLGEVLPAGSGISLDEEEFWQFYAGNRLGFSFLLFISLATSEVRVRGLGMMSDGPFITLVLATELVVSGMVMANLGAISLGPVSQVAAIGALLPTVVLGYSLALGWVAPATFSGWVSLKSMPSQVVGIGAITSAVVLISLQA